MSFEHSDLAVVEVTVYCEAVADVAGLVGCKELVSHEMLAD
jgi:hypothetical protein